MTTVTPSTRATKHGPSDRVNLGSSLQAQLTPEEVSLLLKLPVETLYQWRRKRTGPPAARVGRHLRYDPTKLHAWLESQTKEAA